MAGDPDPVVPHRAAALAVLERDAAVGRVVRARRWMIGGAAALTAALAALASALLPGKSLGAKSRTAVAAGVASRSGANVITPQLPAPADAAQLGLQAPGQAPTASSQSGSQMSQPAPQQAQPAQPAQPAPSAGGAVVSGGS
jgi:hypothetical protein